MGYPVGLAASCGWRTHVRILKRFIPPREKILIRRTHVNAWIEIGHAVGAGTSTARVAPVRVRGLKCGLKLEYVIHISSINAVVAPHEGACIEITPCGRVDGRRRVLNARARFRDYVAFRPPRHPGRGLREYCRSRPDLHAPCSALPRESGSQ